MFTAAIPSVACGTLTWIVVDDEPASTIGVCQTEIDAVLAAKAALAKASVAIATAPTKVVRKGPVIRSFPFVLIYEVFKGLPSTFQKPCR
jgi:predicted aspartyl protease